LGGRFGALRGEVQDGLDLITRHVGILEDLFPWASPSDSQNPHKAARTSVGEKPLAEFGFRKKTACLPEDRVKGTAVDFLVIWDGECLSSALPGDSTNLDMAVPLRKRLEIKLG